MEEYKPRKEVVEWVKQATNMNATSIIRHIEKGTERGREFYYDAERKYDELQAKIKQEDKRLVKEGRE
jgi:hypothetical protein